MPTLLVSILFVPFEDLSLQKGSTTHIKELITVLREKSGYRVTVLTQGKVISDLADEFITLGSNPLTGSALKTGILLPVTLLKILYWLAFYHSRVDVVYTRSIFVCPLYVLLGVFFLFRRKLIYEANGLSGEERRLKGRTIVNRLVVKFIEMNESVSMKYSDRIIAVTPRLKCRISKEFSIKKEKIEVIGNGVNLDLFKPMKDGKKLDGLRRNLEIRSDNRIVCFVGNMAHWQGLEVLVDSALTISQRNRRAKFLVVGDGVLRGKIVNKVNRLGLMNRFVFTGMVPYHEVPVFINMADVCVSPFISERNSAIGLSPLKVFEYMACGKPVVSSNISGLEFMAEERAGLLVAPDDQEELAHGILRVLENSELAKELGENGLRLARSRFAWEAISKNTKKIIDSLL